MLDAGRWLLLGWVALFGAPDPPLTDLSLFPPHAVVWANWQVNREHWRYWYYLAENDPAEQLRWPGPAHEVVAELDRAYRRWDVLDNAQRAAADSGGCRYGRAARSYLAELRNLLGPDYYAGKMPPPVPWWRYRHADRYDPAVTSPDPAPDDLPP